MPMPASFAICCIDASSNGRLPKTRSAARRMYSRRRRSSASRRKADELFMRALRSGFGIHVPERGRCQSLAGQDHLAGPPAEEVEAGQRAGEDEDREVVRARASEAAGVGRAVREEFRERGAENGRERERSADRHVESGLEAHQIEALVRGASVVLTTPEAAPAGSEADPRLDLRVEVVVGLDAGGGAQRRN